jgi:hypothetical protein
MLDNWKNISGKVFISHYIDFLIPSIAYNVQCPDITVERSMPAITAITMLAIPLTHPATLAMIKRTAITSRTTLSMGPMFLSMWIPPLSYVG